MFTYSYEFASIEKKLTIQLNTEEENINFNYTYFCIALKLFSLFSIVYPLKAGSFVEHYKITMDSFYGTIVFYTRKSDRIAFDTMFYNQLVFEFKEFIV